MKAGLELQTAVCNCIASEDFLFNDASSPKKFGFKFQLNRFNRWIQEEIMFVAIAYTLLCELNYGYHN